MSSANTPPFVSVIVPHYRDFVGLELCLSALTAQTYPRDRFEILIADNNSPEGAEAVEAVVKGRGRLVVVTDRGAGPARNGGVAASKGEVLAFIDSDCVSEPAWLEEGVRGLDRFDLVGGRVKVLVGDEARMTGPEAFERVFAFDFKTYIEKKGFTGAGNLFCRRTLFDKVGGFRTGLSEDVEWSRRATATGARLGYAPAAVVGHPARVTWNDLRAKWKRLNFETFGLMAGARHQRLKWLLRNALLPASAVAHTPRVLLSPELNTLPQRGAALVTLYRLRFWRLADAVALLKSS
jgi:GT2 family glycosyltransferase